MEIEKLKILRTLFPGTLILLGLLPAYVYFTKDPVEIGWTLAGVGMVISYGLGTIYNLYCLRKVFNWRSHERITDNIKQRLLKIGRTLSRDPGTSRGDFKDKKPDGYLLQAGGFG